MAILYKYKSFLESWLSLPIEQIEQARGIVVTSTEKRISQPKGWVLKLPVCAFETPRAVIISCAPQFEDEIRILLDGTSVSDAIVKMQRYFHEEKCLSSEYYKSYGLGELNMRVDSADAVMLNECHYEQYVSFYRKTRTALCKLMEKTEGWMPQHFNSILHKETCFCLLRDDEIVSATESQTIPNQPDGIMDIGIHTLKQHRQKGYASIVCTAFIKHYLKNKILPLWSCAFDNQASERLALKLGFIHMGNVFYIASI